MSKAKTKYVYTIYDPSGNLITDQGNYNTLKELGLAPGALSAFSRRKVDDIITKKHRIVRRKCNEDIVQPDLKESDELK